MANRCRASSTGSWSGIVDFTVLCDPPCSKDDPAGSALPVSVGDNAVLPSDLGVVDCRAHYWVKSAAWKIVQLLPVYPDEPTIQSRTRTSHSVPEPEVARGHSAEISYSGKPAPRRCYMICHSREFGSFNRRGIEGIADCAMWSVNSARVFRLQLDWPSAKAAAPEQGSVF
jgi:hypothetical protein